MTAFQFLTSLSSPPSFATSCRSSASAAADALCFPFPVLFDGLLAAAVDAAAPPFPGVFAGEDWR